MRNEEDSLDEDDEESCFLNEEQVTGASLRGRDVATLKVSELKRWLQCRRESTKGFKSDLVARYHNESTCINNDSYKACSHYESNAHWKRINSHCLRSH